VLDGDIGTHGLGLGLEFMNMDDTFALSSPKRHRSTSNSSFQSISLPPGAYPLASTISPLSSLSTESSDSEREGDEPKQRNGRIIAKVPPAVEAVAADLAVIGLNEDASDSWLSRMILLMLYPNMIVTPWASPSACKPRDETDLESETPAELDNHCSPDDGEEHQDDHPASPTSPAASLSPAASASPHAQATSSTVRSQSTTLRSSRRSASPPQPFFSFTRAKGECASVVADVRLLASLFPPADRHMVLSAHELEGVDEIALTSGDVKAAMRCLTIDLPHGLGKSLTHPIFLKFPREIVISRDLFAALCLDAHGLVNHFSSTLHNNGINHLYSSTYKTANLLVCSSDIVRIARLISVRAGRSPGRGASGSASSVMLTMAPKIIFSRQHRSTPQVRPPLFMYAIVPTLLIFVLPKTYMIFLWLLLARPFLLSVAYNLCVRSSHPML
jgi:hypothetical protein